MADTTLSPLQQQMQKLDPQQQTLLQSMGAGQPGSPTSLAPPMSRPEPTDRFPSLEKDVIAGFEVTKFDVTTQPLDLPVVGSMGIELKTDVVPKIKDPRKISPEIKLQQVLDFNNPKIKDNFSKAMGVRNAQGEELMFPQSMDYNTRLDVANRFGTTKIIDDEGELFDVP